MPVTSQVMTWVGSYQETCRELGIEEAELEFPGGQGRGIAALVDCYTTRVHGLLNTWFTNILEVCAGLCVLGQRTISIATDLSSLGCTSTVHLSFRTVKMSRCPADRDPHTPMI